MLYGKLVRESTDSVTRSVSIVLGGFKPMDWKPKRRVGRPCQGWTQCVYEMLLGAFGGSEQPDGYSGAPLDEEESSEDEYVEGTPPPSPKLSRSMHSYKELSQQVGSSKG